MPLKDWPDADKAMWRDLFTSAGPLDDRGGLAHVRETTQESLRPRYGRWLRWLSMADPMALDLEPAERATLDRLKAWLGALEHTKPMSRLAFIDGVLRVLSAAAPEKDWSAQTRLRKRLKHAAGTGDRRRKEGRVASSAVLLAAGLRLAETHSAEAQTPLSQMMRLRDGVMVALLAVLPLRLRSFAGLELGRSIHVNADSIDITLSEADTKKGVAWEAKVPDAVEPVLRRYITEARPFLMDRGGQRHAILWVGERGKIIGSAYISARIGGLTERLIGTNVTAHLFRDAAATTLARLSPDAAKLIRPVLAHTGFGTAERHYIHAQTIDAGRNYAAVLQTLKDETR